MKKLAIYSHDTFGLGNLRRMFGITQHLLDHCEDLSILLISGSSMIHNFTLPRNRFDYLKLPCLNRGLDGAYGVKHLATEFENVVSMRALTIQATIKGFKPDIVLVDKKPGGVAMELMPALRHTKNHNNSTQWVLLLRDILDSPEKTKEIWRKNDYHHLINQFYQRVLVVGSAEVFDVRKEYEMPSSVAGKVEFCGYTHRFAPPIDGTNAETLRRNGKKFVLVTPGGGEDGFNLVNTYLQGLKCLPMAKEFFSLIVTGPEMPEHLQKRVQDTATQIPEVEVKLFTGNLPDYMRGADLVVSMAGYNTLCEILSIRKPAIVVPRTEPVKEQWLRAQLFAAKGLLKCIHPDDLTSTGLIQAVQSRLSQSNVNGHNVKLLDFKGLTNVTRTIQHMLGDAARIRASQSDSRLKAPVDVTDRIPVNLTGRDLLEGSRKRRVAT